MKYESVSYMNCKLRKLFFFVKRNMVRNKYRYGQMYPEEDRTPRNQVVSLPQISIATYVSKESL